MQGKTFTAIIAAEKFTIPRRFMFDKSKEKGKDQESIQSCSTPDAGHRMGKITHKRTKRSVLSSR